MNTNRKENCELRAFAPELLITGVVDCVALQVRNRSDQEARVLFDKVRKSAFNLSLKDASGVSVKPKAGGKKLERSSSQDVPPELKPRTEGGLSLIAHEAYTERYFLGEAFSLKPGGLYSISVSVRVYSLTSRSWEDLTIPEMHFRVAEE